MTTNSLLQSADIVLLVNLSTAVMLLVGASGFRLVRLQGRRWITLGVLPLVNAVVLSVYVFGEDSYRSDGTSRWDAYRSPGGALGEMFVFSVALMVACAAALIYTGFAKKGRLFRLTALGGALTSLVLVTATILGFSLN